jgi:hypothetical protein
MKRVLLDENLPKRLARELGDHTSTAHEQGWAGLTNGELLTRAAGAFEVLLTADQNLQYQQNLKNAEVGVILVVAPSTRMADLEPLRRSPTPGWK